MKGISIKGENAEDMISIGDNFASLYEASRGGVMKGS